MAQLKRDGACKRLVVTGCLAERYAISSRRRFRKSTSCSARAKCRRSSARSNGMQPSAGAGHAVQLRAVRQRRLDSEAPNFEAPSSNPDARAARRISTTRRRPRLLTTPRHYAYVKVAEGCDYTCAFCIIPTLRGKYRSRDEDSIVARSRSAGGARRARTAADLAGHDVLRHRSRRARRARAAAAPAERRSRASRWIRLLYLYPTTITDDVLDAMAECEKVCKYIDLPLQHASADVLRRMRRPGQRDDLRQAARAHPRARARRDAAHDVHRRLPRRDRSRTSTSSCDFVRDTGFDHVGVFTYSHEEGTRAYRAGRRRAGGESRRARRDAHHAAAAADRGGSARRQVGSATIVDVMVEARRPNPTLVCHGPARGPGARHRRGGRTCTSATRRRSRRASCVRRPDHRRARLRSDRATPLPRLAPTVCYTFGWS